jgi:hypothetical protein
MIPHVEALGYMVAVDVCCARCLVVAIQFSCPFTPGSIVPRTICRNYSLTTQADAGTLVVNKEP